MALERILAQAGLNNLTIQLERDLEDGGWVAKVAELHGCISQGDTIEEALEMIRDAMDVWLDTAVELKWHRLKE